MQPEGCPVFGKGAVINRSLSLPPMAMALWLSACAPAGNHYGSFDLADLKDGLTVHPDDDCQRTDVMQGIIAALNTKIEKPDGPSARVTAASGLQQDVDYSALNSNPKTNGKTVCRGTLLTAAGPIGPGRVILDVDRTLDPYAKTKAATVRNAIWETDAQIAACGEPESNFPAIIESLNTKVGNLGGPPRRVTAIRQLAVGVSKTCHATLVFADGTAEIGTLGRNQINQKYDWNWASDKDIASGEVARRAAADGERQFKDMLAGMRANPSKTTECWTGGSRSWMTNDACAALMEAVHDINLLIRKDSETRATILEKCASKMERTLPGRGEPMHRNACESLYANACRSLPPVNVSAYYKCHDYVGRPLN
jgi:hypothetical protein